MTLTAYTQSPFATGLAGINNNNFKCNIYPNPNNGGFAIQLPSTTQPVAIKLIDLTGKTIYNKEQLDNTSGKIIIENTGLTPGIYFCQVVLGDVTVTKKIVITP